MKQLIDSKINEWDMEEHVSFPPLVHVTDENKIAVSKSLSEMEGRAVFDENKNRMAYKITLMKSSDLQYQIVETEHTLKIYIAIDDDSMKCLHEEFDLTGWEYMTEIWKDS